jgi:hypothetical protein
MGSHSTLKADSRAVLDGTEIVVLRVAPHAEDDCEHPAAPEEDAGFANSIQEDEDRGEDETIRDSTIKPSEARPKRDTVIDFILFS